MFYTVYKVTNLLNQKYYIGKHQTKNLDDGYMGSGNLIRRAIKKYGLENFKKEILFVFDSEEEMNAKEKELVVVSEQTYNLCEGGKGGFGYINRNGLGVGFNFIRENNLYMNNVSKEKRTEISRKARSCRINTGKGIPKGTSQMQTEEACLKRLNTLKKLSHQKGDKNSQFGTIWITNGKENKKIKIDKFNEFNALGYIKGRT